MPSTSAFSSTTSPGSAGDGAESSLPRRSAASLRRGAPSSRMRSDAGAVPTPPPATTSRKLGAVRAFLRHALGRERVPDARLAPRRGRRLPDAPAAAEVERLLEALEGEGPVALRNRAPVEIR